MGERWFIVLMVLAIIGLAVLNEADARKEVGCTVLYSLALTNADSLAIARDGCAAYLGRKEATE